jgi:transposase
VVHRTARCGLRATRAQRARLFGLLRSAGDVWCCTLDLNRWRRHRRDAPLAGYQELCRELAVAGPGTFGELDSIGARSVLRRYSDAWFAAAARRKAGDLSARYPRRKRALVPVRWYAGTFTLNGRVLRIPVARDCPPLQVRLDRDVPYPPGQVRSVTLGFDAGRLYLDVTAEVPVASYPPGQEPDPARVAGVDLGIIHPYALAGPGGQQLPVSGRAIRAECRQHLRDRKGRSSAAARRAPKPWQRGSRRWRQHRRSERAARARHRRRVRPAQHEAAKTVVSWAVEHQIGDARGRRPPRRAEPGRRPAAQPAHPRLAPRAPHPRPGRQGRGRRDHRPAGRRAGHVVNVPRLRPPGTQARRAELRLPALRAPRAPRPGRGRQHRRPQRRRPHPRDR